MRYEDASQVSADHGGPIARPDVDVLPSGSYGPATGNAITGQGTNSGAAGADSNGASIVAVQGAGGPGVLANGAYQVSGQYGALSIDTQGNFNYVRNPGTPDGVQDVFQYTLANAAGANASTTLTIDISQVTAAAAGQSMVALPAGVELSDIHVNGRDLVINMPDGTQMVIPNGAVFVPQITIADVAVPASNVAALLIDSEPQPAAGPPQSSGGNFATDVPPLDPGVPLGDLIPPTELSFTPPDTEELAQAVDRKPTVIIETPDNPAGAIDASESVNEKGLPARNGNEPAGSGEIADGNGTNDSDSSETNSGTIVFTAEDGLDSITINGIAVTAVGQHIAGQFGTITITGIDLANGQIAYSYTLGDNTSGDATQDVFAVAVTDSDGDVATASLTVHIIDDVPTARNDTDSADLVHHEATGNVISGAGTTSGASGADTVGADNASVTAVAGAGGAASSFDANGNLVVQGQFGTLEIKADGSYVYHGGAGAIDGAVDTFTYTLTDGDGDTSQATLTITNPDRVPTIVIQTPDNPAGAVNATETVFEKGLPTRGGEPAGSGEIADGNGTNNSDPSEANSGTFVISSPDGVGSVTINGTAVTGAGQHIAGQFGTLTIDSYNPATGQTTYTYVLTDNTSGDATHDDFSVVVTDTDGDQASATLRVNIVDDVPTARNDTDSLDLINHVADGNVITGADTTSGTAGADTVGADNATVSAISGVGGSTSSFDQNGDLVVAGQFGEIHIKADGSYTYTANAGAPAGVIDTFTYTLKDGDGDTSQATLTITNPDHTPTIVIQTPDNPAGAVNATETVFEKGLPTRGGEPAGSGEIADGNGSNNSDASEANTGTFVISSPDGVGSVTINGTAVTGAGQHIAGQFGTLTIDSYDPATGQTTYTYVLTDNTSGDATHDDFSVVVTDTDGDQASATLRVNIVDDVPTAHPDTNSVAEGATVTGNVETNDIPGADDYTAGGGVTGVVAGNHTGSPVSGNVGNVVHGAYGDLTLNANGTYSYKSTANGVTGNVADTFTYTITDGDGDTSTTTLVINVNNATLVVTDNDAVVNEAGLVPNGSHAGDGSAVDSNGQITVTGGTGPYTYTLTSSATGAHGTLVLNTATGQYTYTLTSPVDEGDVNNGADTVTNADHFNYTVTDSLGNTVTTGVINVDIIDDIPVATNDGNLATLDDGAAGVIVGTVAGITGNDTFGADGAGAPAVTIATGSLGGTVTIDGSGNLVYTSHHNTAAGQTDTETFTYTIKDSDGDTSTATFTVKLTDSAPGPGGTVNLTLSEAALDLTKGGSDLAAGIATGTNPGSPDETQVVVPASGLSFAANSDALSSVAFNSTQSGITVSGLTSGYSLSWAVSGGQLIGTLHGPGNTNLGTAVIVALTGDTGSTAANGTAHVGVTATLVGPLSDTGTQITINGIDVIATQVDNDQSHGTVNITVTDDAPTAADDGNLATVDDTAAGVIVGSVAGITGNDDYGADGVGTPAIMIGTGSLGGTVTVDGAGNLVYTSHHNTAAGATDTETFTYTITDGDGDTATAQFTVKLTDTGPGAGGNVNLTLNEAALDTTQDTNDLAAGTVTGTDPTSPTETQVVPPATGLSFATGSDALVSVAFNSTQSGISVSGLESGYSLTWAVSGGQLIGTLHAPGNTSLGTAIVVELTGDTGSTAANSTAHVGVTATLVGPLEHNNPPGMQGPVTITGIDVVATQTDNDTSHGSVSISVTDDTPIALDDGNLATVDDNVSNFDLGAVSALLLSNDDYGADGPGTPSITIATGDKGGTISIVGGHLIYTSHDNVTPGVTETETFVYTITDGDGDTDTATFTVKLTDTGPSIDAVSASIAVDEDGLSGGIAGTVYLDGSDLAGEAISQSGNLSGLSFGNDVPGNIVLTASADTGLRTLSGQVVKSAWDGATHTLTGFVDTNGNGSVDSGETKVFTLQIDNVSTGHYVFNLLQPVQHPTANTEDDKTFSVGVTVTDAESDPASSQINILIDDDSPDAQTSGAGVGSVKLDESAAGTDTAGGGTPTGIASDTINLAAGFVTGANVHYGADGASASGAVTYALHLSANNIGSGLYALDPTDTESVVDPYGRGDEILLSQSGNVITGSVNNVTYFTITIDPATGIATFEQFHNIWHPNAGSSSAALDDTATLTTAAASDIQVIQTVTDGDGDKDSAAVDLGSGIFQIQDDGPSASIGKTGQSVSLDESANLQADSNDVAGPLTVFSTVTNTGVDPDLSGPLYAFNNIAVINSTSSSTGTDGGTIAFGLDVSSAGVDSTLNTTDGHDILLFKEGDLIVGRVSGGTDSGKAAFALSIDSSGKISMVEYLSIQHPDAANPDDSVSIATAALLATVTVTDADGDKSTASTAIGNLISFQDSGPIMTAASTINIQNSGDLAADGTFAYLLGADGAPTNNDVFKSVTFSASVNGTTVQTTTPLTQVSEDAHTATFSFSFTYSTGVGTATENGTLTFYKDSSVAGHPAGTYTVDLQDPIAGVSSFQTAQGTAFVGYVFNTTTVTGSQPGVAVTTIKAETAAGAHDGFYVQFTGFTAGNGSHETIGDGSVTTFVNGDLFSEGTSLHQSWVSVSNASNGVAGDTINGPDGLNFSLYNSDPKGLYSGDLGNTPTASADNIFLRFDGVGASDDLIVVLKLWNDGNHNGVIEAGEITSKAIVVDSGDIYRFGGSGAGSQEGDTVAAFAGSPYQTVVAGIVAEGGSNNNDGLVVIESNDYNAAGESYKIVGAEIVNTADGITGTGINLNPTVGASGGSSTSEALANAIDTSPLKITNIGFLTQTTTAQSAQLTFNVTIQDGDGDTVTQAITASVSGSADSSTPITLSAAVTTVAPVVLDLDGNGVQFLSAAAGVTYDYGHGAVPTAWAAPGDGILVLDANHNGTVDNASEFVFGGAGQSDLDGLAAYDTNGDRQLSSADANFASFAVWQDANSNGKVDAGELQSLMARGITSISLTSDGISYTAAGGDVAVAGTGSFTFANGAKGALADAAFAIGSRGGEVEARSPSASASNVTLMAALAAAGLSSASASYAESHSSFHGDAVPLSGSFSHEALTTTIAASGSDYQGIDASSMLGTWLPHDVARGEVSMPTAHNEIVGRQALTTNDVKAPAFAELLQGSHGATHADAPASMPVAAMAVAMPSAEQLAAAGSAATIAHGQTVAGLNAVQHNEVVSKVLADSLNGGEGHGPNVEALVNQLGGHGNGQSALEALASHASGGASFGHMGFATAFGGMHGMGMEMMHQDAAPAHA